MPPDAVRGVLVGVDVGTSAVKVLAMTPDGRLVASAAAQYPLNTPQPGWVEQDAALVLRATAAAVHEVLGEVARRSGEVVAIGFSAAMHGLLPVDAAGTPLGPLVTWMDRRAAHVAQRWREDGTAALLYAGTGAPVHPMLPSCKLRWFAEHDPAYVKRAAKFVSMKELIIFRLTGDWLVDWGMASGTGLFDLHTRAWSESALAAAHIDAAKVPTPAPPSTLRRARRTATAAAMGVSEGTPLVLASSDGALANLGVGAVEPGEVALTLGTSGAVRTVVEHAVLDEGGRTFCYAYDDSKYIIGGPTSSGGTVLAKLQDLLLADIPPAGRFEQAIGLADQVRPGANGLTMMPFLSGERAPYWLPELRGGMLGLDLSHTRGDILRAAFESVVFALASVFGVLSEHIGAPKNLRLSGGLMRAPFVRQLVANIFARRAVLSDPSEASAFGAAMMAGIATGVPANDRAVAALLQPVHVHEPEPAMVTLYEEAFARYRSVVDANLGLFAGC